MEEKINNLLNLCIGFLENQKTPAIEKYIDKAIDEIVKKQQTPGFLNKVVTSTIPMIVVSEQGRSLIKQLSKQHQEYKRGDLVAQLKEIKDILEDLLEIVNNNYQNPDLVEEFLKKIFAYANMIKKIYIQGMV